MAFLKIKRRSTTVAVIPPLLNWNFETMAFELFRNKIQNYSCYRHAIIGLIISKTIRIKLIFTFLLIRVYLWRLPSYNAAAILIDFTSPVPLNFIRLHKDNLPKLFKLFFTVDNISFDKSTAFKSKVPEPIRMSISLALDKNLGPLSLSFYRDWSEIDHCLILRFFWTYLFFRFKDTL